jgi:quinol monooxygenase YgiN
VVRLAVVLAAPVRGSQQLVDTLRFLARSISFEPGCLGCRVSTPDNDAAVIRYEEEWVSEEAMRLRVRSQRFTRFLEVLESAPRAPSVQFDFVNETRGLDYIEEVRKSLR